MKKTILITGADGFIGRNLIKGLLGTEYDIYALIHSNMKAFKDLYQGENLHIIECDLIDIFEYEDIIPDNIMVMYHLAWRGVKPENRNDFYMQISNIELTLKCMEFAYRKKIKKVVFPGSTNEYLYYGKPLNRDAVPSPKDAYGCVKIALRYLCEQYAIQSNMQFIYTIIAGIYASDRKDNNVIFYTINKLLHKEKPSLTKLEQLWDYVYIDDVIEALIAVGNLGKGGGVYAIGHGDNWPLNNYIRIIHEKIDSSLALGIGEIEYSENQLPCSCIDLTDLIKDTGFIPKVGFEEGITMVIEKIKGEMVNNGQ